MYTKFWKRFLDFTLSLIALLVLCPVFLILSILGVIVMNGNPFFTQERPGRHERIFRLVKFRTMSNKKDEQGNLLPDELRLNKYGKFLRVTSLDELPELFNILKGDMAFIGPRPLLVEYLPWYSDSEKHRHDVRPGLTGWAQVNGRNYLSWEEKFSFDLEYIRKLSFRFDVEIVFRTIGKVLCRSDVEEADDYEIDSDGNKWCWKSGEKLRIHEPLDIERGKALK